MDVFFIHFRKGFQSRGTDSKKWEKNPQLLPKVLFCGMRHVPRDKKGAFAAIFLSVGTMSVCHLHGTSTPAAPYI